MFNIGDKIVYPNQGIGVIDRIEQKEFKGEIESYYKIHLLSNTMKLMLPIKRADDSNIRLISNSDFLDEKLKEAAEFKGEIEELRKINYKERNAINSEKIKSGDLSRCLEVICNLTALKAKQNLNSSEKYMLNNAKKIVIEEISQVKNLSNDEATNLLESCIMS